MATDDPTCRDCGESLSPDVTAGICPRCMLLRGLCDEWPISPRATNGSPPGRFEPPSPDGLADLFPQLEILELLGCGGMGAVFKVRQRTLDRLAALKVLPPEVEADPSFAERFAREARAMAKLVHPHIAVVYDYGQAAGTHYLLLEYVEGATLREAIAARSLSAEQALAIMPQICDALQYAHDAHIVHRDIKPENILLDRQGQVKIADFGLAKLMPACQPDFSLTDARQTMGTPHYMAPEQLENSHAVDHRADIYALGVVFYEMLTGELPLGRFAPPSQKSGVDARLDEVVHKALESQPARRYQSAVEVKADVAEICRVPARPKPRPAEAAPLLLAAWRQWRKEYPSTGRQLLKLATLCVYAGCMIAFFGVGGTSGWIRWGNRDEYYLHTVGIPDRWLEFTGRKPPGQPPVLEVDLFLDSGAWFWLPGAALAYYLFWRMRKTENPALGRFRIPWSHVAFWAVFGLAAIASGTRFDLHQAAFDLWSLRPVRLL